MPIHTHYKRWQLTPVGWLRRPCHFFLSRKILMRILGTLAGVPIKKWWWGQTFLTGFNNKVTSAVVERYIKKNIGAFCLPLRPQICSTPPPPPTCLFVLRAGARRREWGGRGHKRHCLFFFVCEPMRLLRKCICCLPIASQTLLSYHRLILMIAFLLPLSGRSSSGGYAAWWCSCLPLKMVLLLADEDDG